MRNFLLLILLCLSVSCKKQEVATYSAEEGINFYITNTETDSLSYSFAISATPKEQDTIFLKMRILGAISDKPRAFAVEAAEGSTARLGVDYELPSFIVPAGAFTVVYPVVVFKTPEMSSRSFRLVVKVAGDKGLKPGAIGTEIGNGIATTQSVNQIKIDISNRILKPSYWGQVESTFGAFSETKFKFMIQVTGLTDFSEEAIGIDGFYNLPVKLQNELLAYEAIHGPLIDESGNPVTF